VCPLVEESEKLQARAATELAEHVRQHHLREFRVGLLHGQMRPVEKEEAMRRFKERELDVLVATPVIEVGVDVPNACVIVIESADRFGLAQLHQLRGRVGRGEHHSFCVLLADPKTEDGRDRLRVMVETQDGFRIAEEDLRLRGPGEVLGTRQSGLPEFFVGDIVSDREVMEAARQDAFGLIAADPELTDPAHAALKEAIARTRIGCELLHVS
jgi:ATP-dependent DNA helicase RecG